MCNIAMIATVIFVLFCPAVLIYILVGTTAIAVYLVILMPSLLVIALIYRLIKTCFRG